MAVGVWGRSPHEARRRRENFSGFLPFQAPETARNGMKPKRNLWQFKPPGLLGLDLEASARDRRLRLCGHTILKQSGLQNSRKQLWRVAGERRAPPTHEHSAQHSSILKTRQTPTLVFALFRPHPPSSSCVANGAAADVVP